MKIVSCAQIENNVCSNGLSTITTTTKALHVEYREPEDLFFQLDKGEASYMIDFERGKERMAVICTELLYEIHIFEKYARIQDSQGQLIYEEKEKGFNLLQDILDLYEQPCKDMSIWGQSPFTVVGYDAVRQFEKKLKKERKIHNPDIVILVPEVALVLNEHTKEIMLVVNSKSDCDLNFNKIEEQYKQLFGQKVRRNKRQQVLNTNMTPVYSHEEAEFCDLVKRAQEYISSGDIFQVVLSVESKMYTHDSDLEIYRKMVAKNKTVANYLIRTRSFSIVGASPEILVEKNKDKCILKPLAGTAVHGGEKRPDLEKKLLNSEKDCAEHRMLVDLARNDLGRVCKWNTVRPEKLLTVEYYYHVMHIVSSIIGELDTEADTLDLFRSCFPAGTMAGAPKIRAIEIIDKLEKKSRGYYSGGLGFFTPSKDILSFINIRSITLIDKIAYARAGAGIVHDSIPEEEYKECINKLENALAALQVQ